MKAQYNRILLKISGEVLAGDKEFGIDYKTVNSITQAIAKVSALGVDVGIVVGGGNFWRGRTNPNMDRVRADHIGMLATVMNALAINDALEQAGVEVRTQTAIEMRQIAEPFIRNKAIRHMEKGRIVVFACGTGSPYFSTDTGAALRAAEIGADVIFKATNVEGIYDCDPKENPNAVKFDSITYNEIIAKGLHVMDTTATSLCMDNNIPIIVFNLDNPENIIKAVCGENIGTKVVSEKGE
ncbi:MAG: UMP kinase [Clostridia bacterium]|nr:UMP kinase [Clostridia bacterium]